MSTRRAVAAVALACIIAACSSSDESPQPVPGAGGSVDASVDTTPDVSVDRIADSVVETVDHDDGNSDVVDAITDPVEDVVTAVCAEGTWGTVENTGCDIVMQDCANPLQSCVAFYSPTTGSGTECRDFNKGLKDRGQSCEAHADCRAGMLCTFKRCAPYCCPQAQYELCGPGGLCNVNLTVGETYVLLCSYTQSCTFWANECPANEYCHPLMKDGSGACFPLAGDQPLADNEPCDYMNECGESSVCAPLSLESQAHCRLLCARSEPPFDGGTPDGGEGHGGCPPGSNCVLLPSYPSWLGACRPVDGG